MKVVTKIVFVILTGLDMVISLTLNVTFHKKNEEACIQCWGKAIK